MGAYLPTYLPTYQSEAEALKSLLLLPLMAAIYAVLELMKALSSVCLLLRSAQWVGLDVERQLALLFASLHHVTAWAGPAVAHVVRALEWLFSLLARLDLNYVMQVG